METYLLLWDTGSKEEVGVLGFVEDACCGCEYALLCVIGDMNDLLHHSDKKGRVPRPEWMLNGFREAVRDCDLIDLHIEGGPYTWRKSLGTPRAVEERLVRALEIIDWFQVFPMARLQNLMAPMSGHAPIMLQCVPPI